jgi:hypothetical protein
MVVKETVYDAFYKLEYPHDQNTLCIWRRSAEVPKKKINDVFERRWYSDLKRELNEAMDNIWLHHYQYPLVTDIDPDIQKMQWIAKTPDREKLLNLKQKHQE